MDITLTVSSEPFALSVPPGDTLLDTLRSSIGVRSPKIGCERGDCGSCTVLLDGEAVAAAIERVRAEITERKKSFRRARLVELLEPAADWAASAVINS